MKSCYLGSQETHGMLTLSITQTDKVKVLILFRKLTRPEKQIFSRKNIHVLLIKGVIDNNVFTATMWFAII